VLKKNNHLKLAAFLSGASLLATESLSFKFVDFTVGSFSFNYQTVVLSFILGASIGGICSNYLRRFFLIEWLLSLINFLFAFYLAEILSFSAHIFQVFTPYVHPQILSSLLGASYVFPLALGLGVVFPFISERLENVKLSYALYSLGGALSFLLFEFYFYPHFGLPISFNFLAGMHLLTGALLFPFRTLPFSPKPLSTFSLYLFILGIITGCYQGLWSVMAELIFKPYYYITPMVAFLFLLGISIGGLLSLKKKVSFESTLEYITVSMLYSALTLWIYSEVTQEAPLGIVNAFLLMSGILLPSTICIGMIFPSFFPLLKSEKGKIAMQLFGLSLGNILGLIISGVTYFIFPLPFISFGILLITILIISWSQVKKKSALFILSGLLVLSPFLISPTKIAQRGKNFKMKELKIHQSFGALNEVSLLLKEEDGFMRLYQNGHAGGKLKPKSLMYEALVAGKAMAYASKLEKALVLGAGYGHTAGYAALFFKETFVMDIGATVPKLLKYLGRYNYNLWSNPRVKFFNLDGSLAPYIFKRDNFDIVINTVHPPYFKNATKLYTAEYIEGVKKILTDKGIFVSWMTSQLSPLPLQILTNTSNKVFAHCQLFNNWDSSGQESFEYVLNICSKSPLKYQLSKHSKLYKSNLKPSRHLRKIGADPMRIKQFHTTKEVHSFLYPAKSILKSGYR